MRASHFRRDRRGDADYWPGFVDAMAALLLVILFILSVFVLAQHYLSRELSGRDSVLDSLRRQVSELSALLALERENKRELAINLDSLRASLTSIEEENQRLQSESQRLERDDRQVEGVIASLRQGLSQEQKLSEEALSKVDVLNLQIAALRRQIAALETALEASEQRDRESNVQIANLGQRLNVALARKVSELALYRSDFLGRLRQILGDRPGIEIVGDRFILQSEVLFPSGSSELNPGGKSELRVLADLVLELERQIPSDIDWILRIDGHTDIRPIQTAQYPSNWELSQARALAVAREMIAAGVPSQRLVPAGLGEFHPVDLTNSEQAYQRNRRIEVKLTQL